MEAKPPFLLQFLVDWLNQVFGGWIPITPTVVMTWIISIGLVICAIITRFSLKMVPRGIQNLLEILIEQVLQMLEGMMGHKKAKFFLPLIGTLALFILISNLIGLIPGLRAPTADWNTTIALALIVFILAQFFGIKERGLIGYLKHFAGPIWWLSPLMILVHLIGELAKPFSLSIRLFVNMMSKHLLLSCLAFLIVIFSQKIILFVQTLFIPLFLPPFVMILGLLTCFIQTFIFVLLSVIYLSTAMEEEEH